VEKLLGALPVVAEFCRRLDLQGIVDRACPVREVARVTHGQVIEALVANRLTSPRPLLRVQDWAGEWAVEEAFGIAPDTLNDDRIGRALDAVAPELERIVGSVGARAIASFGVDVARLHWDMTSISVYGAYEDPEAGFAAPRWGKPKDRRPDLKQVQTGLAVSGDGGVPVWHRAYDGGAGEVAQVVGAMTALRELAGERGLLLVGDSKLLWRGNIIAMHQARVGFIAPAAKPYLPAARLGALDPKAATAVDYVAERDQGSPAEQRGSYRAWRAPSPWPASARPTPTWPSAACSSGPGRGPRPPRKAAPRSWTAPAMSCSGSSAALAAPLPDPGQGRRPGADHRPRPQAGRAAMRPGRHRPRHRQAHPFLVVRPGCPGRRAGHRRLVWAGDQPERGAGRRRRDPAPLQGPRGRGAPLRHLQRPAGGRADVPQRQPAHRRPGQRDLPGVAGVLPVERAVRQAIAPAVTLPGLYVGRLAKPTGRLVFEALARLRLNPARGHDPPTIPIPAPLQAKLLELLDIDPTRPRWAS
jgi:Domain of unknown function (DUF4277)